MKQLKLTKQTLKLIKNPYNTMVTDMLIADFVPLCVSTQNRQNFKNLRQRSVDLWQEIYV